MAKKINIGLIGVGRLGKHYATYLKGRVRGANLVALCDPEGKALSQCAEETEVSAMYPNYSDLVESSKIDAVIIVSPTGTHKDVIIAAANADKAIFCEKPLCLSLEECAEVQQILEKTGVFFQVGYMRRFDPGYSAAKAKVEAGEIGRPVVYRGTTRDPHRPSLKFADPKMSGGLFVDMGIHDFDLGRWFMGGVKSVFARGGVLAYPEMNSINDIDNGVASLQFESGALGSVDLSRNSIFGYNIFTEIVGTEGTLKVGYLRETPVLVMKKEGVSHDATPFFMERFEAAYVKQLQNFIDNLIEEKSPPVTLEDGVESLKISLAAKQSFDTGQDVPLKRIF